MIVRFELAYGGDVYINPSTISSFRWVPGAVHVSMVDGQAFDLKGAAPEFYRKLTDLGFTADSLVPRDRPGTERLIP